MPSCSLTSASVRPTCALTYCRTTSVFSARSDRSAGRQRARISRGRGKGVQRTSVPRRLGPRDINRAQLGLVRGWVGEVVRRELGRQCGELGLERRAVGEKGGAVVLRRRSWKRERVSRGAADGGVYAPPRRGRRTVGSLPTPAACTSAWSCECDASTDASSAVLAASVACLAALFERWGTARASGHAQRGRSSGRRHTHVAV